VQQGAELCKNSSRKGEVTHRGLVEEEAGERGVLHDPPPTHTPGRLGSRGWHWEQAFGS
jgi:hypothetical protein